MSRMLLLSALPAFVALAGVSYAGSFYTHADCQGTSIAVSWTFQGDPGGEPQFVAYDVYRQVMPECPDAIRVNDEPFPRIPGQTHSHTFVDETIVSGPMYRYEIVLVDEFRNPVTVPGPPLFCDPCDKRSWASCPSYSAPLTHATLIDEGWAFWAQPCPDTCYEGFLVEYPWPPELEQYVGTGTAVQLFGPYYCGGVEGCGMTVTHFEVVPCGVVPVMPSTWGTLKATYR
jgi:hypothetical protein